MAALPPTRRGLLAGAAALSAAGAVVAVPAPAAPAAADAELIALCAQFDALERQYLALFDGLAGGNRG
jgi:hypothetical protein